MYEAPEYRYRKDCFAYRGCRCAALKRFYNAGGTDQCAGCPFYKTRKRFAEENKRCLERAKRSGAPERLLESLKAIIKEAKGERA